MIPEAGTAGVLQLGRPKNRKRVYPGDRTTLVDEKPLWGPDAHGVYWRPARAYYEAEPDETLVIVVPVHPDELPPGIR